MIPQCPNCASTRIGNDDPPLRGYVLASLGCMMIFAGSFLSPDVFAPGMAGEQTRLILFGFLVVAYAMALLLRHHNRYCHTCGTRFRQPGTLARTPPPADAEGTRAAAASRIDAAMEKAERQLHRQSVGMHGFSATPSATSSSSSRPGLSPNQPIEPLLACLKFRDPRQRATAHESLRTLTGVDLPEDYETWATWWKENKADYKARRRTS